MDYSYLTEISGEQLFKECLQRCGLNLTNVILDEWVLMRNKKVLVNVKKIVLECLNITSELACSRNNSCSRRMQIVQW